MKKRYFVTFVVAIIALVKGKNWLTKYRRGKMPPRFADLPKGFFFQGHRGARGLLPENTIPSFLKSLDFGVTTLELDVVVSQDKQIVVSHESWFSPKICTKPNGEAVSKNEEKTHLIYQMPYTAIRAFDCGLRKHPNFPQQQTIPTYKPLLKELIKETKKYAHENKLPNVRYNIEVKTEGEKGDHIYQPPPEEYVELLYEIIRELDMETQVIVQSFDIRILQAMREIDERISLALLIDNGYSIERNLKQLGFTPYAYAPNYRLINRRLVEKVKSRGMLLFAWTVNDLQTMNHLIQLGVDSIITDYPNLSRAFLTE